MGGIAIDLWASSSEGSYKDITGRCFKRSTWKEAVNVVLLDEFGMLRAFGVRVNNVLLQDPTLHLLSSLQVLTIQDVVLETGRPINLVINSHYICDFCDRYNILDFAGTKRSRYHEVSDAGVGFLGMRIIGGTQSRIENPFVIFQNKASSYRIAGVPGNILGITYRSTPTRWMNKRAVGRIISRLKSHNCTE